MIRIAYQPLAESILAASIVVVCAPAAAAQFKHPSPLPDLLVVNDSFGMSVPTLPSSDLFEDQLVRLADFDGDGTYTGLLETSLYFEYGISPNKNKNWQIQYVRSRIEGGLPAVYFTNGRKGETGGGYVAQVMRAQDVDGNGFVSGSELSMVMDLELVMGGAQGCESVCIAPNGDLFAVTDFPGGGIVHRKNGVPTVIVKDSLGPYKVLGKNGAQVTIDTDDMTNCTQYKNGGVLVYSDGFGSAKDEAVHRFMDLNGDGDITDPGEAANFLNASGANLGLVKNPDFGTLLPSIVVNAQTGAYCWVKELATMDELGVETYFIASNSSNTGSFSQNVSGQYVNGLIFRGVDVDGDGDLNETGEVNLYYDGSGVGALPEQLDKILGVDVYEQSLIVFFLKGGDVAVCILTDLNGDGDAMDEGERLDPWAESLSDAPQWNLFFYGVKVGAVEPGLIGEPLSRQATFTGTACANYPGPAPRITAQGDCKIGTQFFEVQVREAPPNSVAVLFLGLGSSYFGQPLPLSLAFLGLPQCTLYQSLMFSWNVATDPTGFGRISFVDSFQNPNLAGASLKTQFVTIDASTGQALLGFTGLMTLNVP